MLRGLGLMMILIYFVFGLACFITGVWLIGIVTWAFAYWLIGIRIAADAIGKTGISNKEAFSIALKWPKYLREKKNGKA